ncbi:SMI1/KNR4 family protein [Pigmentibacter sp. JX0631]|uniref:SMI1/KNR4 family protein n=1 Tax=Pigmentibacter sp. JX0631 TaxID=2976982 RepID=UPI0024691636|nr:SMI1/KNR4 family protein [Pigmentibacter sp. JX0631]WGL59625.1 SMI1/KNR4 family protein [Pigmentibacter sp. JX0631]
MRNEIEWIASEQPTNIDQIKEFEIKSGYKFPKSYIDLMIKYNGATILNYITSFKVYYKSGKMYPNTFGIGQFLAFGEESISHITNLIDWCNDNNNRDENYPIPEFILPIIYDGGGNYVCFDYRHDPKTDNPKVVFWFHEEAGCLEEGLEVYFIANSFDEFLDCLFDSRTEKEKVEDEISRKEYLEMFGSK